jgi:hypothetical protein
MCSVTCSGVGIGTYSVKATLLVAWVSCLWVCEDGIQKDTYSIRALEVQNGVGCCFLHQTTKFNGKGIQRLVNEWVGCLYASQWLREAVGCSNCFLVHFYWTVDRRGFSPILDIDRSCINIYKATVILSISVDVTCKRCHVNYGTVLPTKVSKHFVKVSYISFNFIRSFATREPSGNCDK